MACYPGGVPKRDPQGLIGFQCYPGMACYPGGVPKREEVKEEKRSGIECKFPIAIDNIGQHTNHDARLYLSSQLTLCGGLPDGWMVTNCGRLVDR